MSRARNERRLKARLAHEKTELRRTEQKVAGLQGRLRRLDEALVERVVNSDGARDAVRELTDQVVVGMAAAERPVGFGRDKDTGAIVLTNAEDLSHVRRSVRGALAGMMSESLLKIASENCGTDDPIAPQLFCDMVLDRLTAHMVRVGAGWEDKPAGRAYLPSHTAGAETMELVLAADLRRLVEHADMLRAGGYDTTGQDKAIQQLAKTGPLLVVATDDGQPDDVRSEAIMQLADVRAGVEDVIVSARQLLGMPPETPAEAEAVYHKTVEEHRSGGFGLAAPRMRRSFRGGGINDTEIPPEKLAHQYISTAMGFTEAHREALFARLKLMADPESLETDQLPDTERDLGFKSSFVGLADNWLDATLMRLGVATWEACGGSEVDPAEADARCYAWLKWLYIASAKSTMAKLSAAARIGMFARRWAAQAFQKITTTHTFAAALMCTDAHRDAMTALQMSWRAFMVVVPNGLLKVEDGAGGTFDYQRILVDVDTAGHATMTMYDPAYRPANGEYVPGMCVSTVAPDLASLLYDDPATMRVTHGPTAARDPEAVARAMKCARRLVTGLLLAMQDPRNIGKSKRTHGGETRRKGGEPDHRVTFIGRALTIDCRPTVQRFLTTGAGKRGGPQTVQVLVRGHFKTQPHGPRSTMRKIIWREPFWRGPDDAPILTRPKAVTGGA